MIKPVWGAVRSLNSFTNAMMLMPCCPRAGPIGGAGVALPAGAWTFTTARTFLAIGLCLLHLQEVQLHRRLATEHGDEDPQLVLLRVDLVDGAQELGEGAGDDLAPVPLLVGDPDLGRV